MNLSSRKKARFHHAVTLSLSKGEQFTHRDSQTCRAYFVPSS
jgi:hypothetical protein